METIGTLIIVIALASLPYWILRKDTSFERPAIAVVICIMGGSVLVLQDRISGITLMKDLLSIKTSAESELTNIQEVRQEVDNNAQEIKIISEKAKSDIAALAEEIGGLQQRSEILMLADMAIAQDDRKSFNELVRIRDESPVDSSIAQIAKAELIRVKNSYIGSTRTRGVALKITREDGEVVEGGDLSTNEVINILLHGDAKYRAVAARRLRSRRCKSVLAALWGAIQTETSLEVVEEAKRAFGSITGYKQRDVFEIRPHLEEWWTTHSERVSGELEECE